MYNNLYIQNEESSEIIYLDTNKYSVASNELINQYTEGRSVGAYLFKRIMRLSNVLQTEEDKEEYLSEVADDIFKNYTLRWSRSRNVINNHSRKFVRYVIFNTLKKKLDEYIKKLADVY